VRNYESRLRKLRESIPKDTASRDRALKIVQGPWYGPRPRWTKEREAAARELVGMMGPAGQTIVNLQRVKW
jgi:hypothetical protein